MDEQDEITRRVNSPFRLVEDVERVYRHWVRVMAPHPAAAEMARRKLGLVESLLNGKFSAADLMRTIDGAAGDDWTMGRSKDNSTPFNALHQLFKSDEKALRLLGCWKAPPPVVDPSVHCEWRGCEHLADVIVYGRCCCPPHATLVKSTIKSMGIHAADYNQAVPATDECVEWLTEEEAKALPRGEKWRPSCAGPDREHVQCKVKTCKESVRHEKQHQGLCETHYYRVEDAWADVCLFCFRWARYGRCNRDDCERSGLGEDIPKRRELFQEWKMWQEGEWDCPEWVARCDDARTVGREERVVERRHVGRRSGDVSSLVANLRARMVMR